MNRPLRLIPTKQTPNVDPSFSSSIRANISSTTNEAIRLALIRSLLKNMLSTQVHPVEYSGLATSSFPSLQAKKRLTRMLPKDIKKPLARPPILKKVDPVRVGISIKKKVARKRDGDLALLEKVPSDGISGADVLLQLSRAQAPRV